MIGLGRMVGLVWAPVGNSALDRDPQSDPHSMSRERGEGAPPYNNVSIFIA
jgi:hypothetical protein